jgi:UDP-N-acetylmuramate: L-alanyl-gamma-D-glutamyl-meso-diaminopimelate ligase
MGSLAGMLQAQGFRVTGSDQNIYPPMSTFLEDLGISLFKGYSETHLEPRPDLVVVGNAISRGNAEVEVTLNERIRYASMAEVLKEFFLRGKSSIVIAGTHGKTTTASLLAWLLEDAGLNPSFLVGGIAENFGSSFKLGTGDLFIIEGDEYDTAFFDKGPKFLHYLPDWVIFNNCEFDHADIYPNFEAVRLSFQRLINLIPSKGKLIAGWDDPVVRDLSARAFCPVESFGLEDEPLWKAGSIQVLEEVTRFEIFRGNTFWGKFEIPLAGTFNVKNAIAAVACAQGLGVGREALDRGLRSYRNVKRRLEFRGEVRGVTVFDDFAHHPTAIYETLKAVKARYPNNRLWAIFEPRSATSRRNVFQKKFVRCFESADHVVLCSPFSPEKLDAAARLDVGQLVKELRETGMSADHWDSADEIVQHVTPNLEKGDKIVIMSNGGFDGIHGKLLESLRSL